MITNELINEKLAQNGWNRLAFDNFSKFMNVEINKVKREKELYTLDQLWEMFELEMNVQPCYCEMETSREISALIAKQTEMAYRRGYSHGVAVGLLNDKESMEKNKTWDKINLWKRDYNIKKGSPGSNFENVFFNV